MKKNSKRKQAKARKRKRPAVSAKFAVGDQVVVKMGSRDPDFPDLPLGGWVGIVTARHADPPGYSYDIKWSSETLAQMPEIVRKRAERDGLGLENMNLSGSELELYEGQPVTLEQPDNIVSRPLSTDDEDDRVRKIMGLTSDDPVPDVDDNTLGIYYRYLKKHLKFPFAGRYSEERPWKDIEHEIQVIGLLDPEEDDDFYGLIVEAKERKGRICIPLSEVEVSRKDSHHQLISDYSYWFWNWR